MLEVAPSTRVAATVAAGKPRLMRSRLRHSFSWNGITRCVWFSWCIPVCRGCHVPAAGHSSSRRLSSDWPSSFCAGQLPPSGSPCGPRDRRRQWCFYGVWLQKQRLYRLVCAVPLGGTCFIVFACVCVIALMPPNFHPTIKGMG